MSDNYVDHYQKWHVPTVEHALQLASVYEGILASHLPAGKDSAVLDIGCGMGFALWYLQRKGYTNCSGIDIDRGQVDAK